ncbi:hypothetical protein MSAN_01739200 [Mycena sanguinolenta]|uniref:Uncharacterized protein n=1 Tax=Mycena sanguinolenta TaxID=230812 RepID=A0A8H6Y019_9AGAR|nr:hypothetical protein MSAN_01739200 [Mycena sanguinolenta]
MLAPILVRSLVGRFPRPTTYDIVSSWDFIKCRRCGATREEPSRIAGVWLRYPKEQRKEREKDNVQCSPATLGRTSLAWSCGTAQLVLVPTSFRLFTSTDTATTPHRLTAPHSRDFTQGDCWQVSST